MTNSNIENLSSSSPHRLPTVSASQALQSISSTSRRPIPTGLKRLDAFLQGREYDASNQTTLTGGISRGEVTEIFGPPGVGKTVLAMRVAVSALRLGGSVVWVDSSYEISGPRLRDILSDVYVPGEEAMLDQESVDEYLKRFHHFTAPSLPHLLALLVHQSTSFPPTGTSLIVVDSISTLFTLAFPKTGENLSSHQPSDKKNDATQWASGRRWAVMSDFISQISKLAATRNITILLTSQMTTRISSEIGAVMHPAISGTAWDSGISTRIVVFRDWMFKATDAASSQGEYVPDVRLARVMKAKGVSYEGVGKVVMFSIEKSGLREIQIDQIEMRLNKLSVLPSTSMKRKRGEIIDSQSEDEEVDSDEEFGWSEENKTLDTEAVAG